jgi:nicotinate phosphoribosyltransferase
MPHALIAAYGGDTVEATRKFDQYIDPNVVRISLVDFDNDSVRTSLEVARALGDRLGAVRLDTSENMVDLCLQPIADLAGDDKEFRGVNPHLVEKVREALDREEFRHVGIFVSGGFNAEKIRKFEALGLPVTGYGVGSAFFDRKGGKFEYTADVVEPVSKAGRGLWKGPELHKVDLKDIL